LQQDVSEVALNGRHLDDNGNTNHILEFLYGFVFH